MFWLILFLYAFGFGFTLEMIEAKHRGGKFSLVVKQLLWFIFAPYYIIIYLFKGK